MKTTRRGIERREVIESYVRYDCGKKGQAAPQLQAWDWDHADAIDVELRQAELKCGILAGYIKWDFAALSVDDLRGCAVQRGILASQVLSVAERSGALGNWRPDRPNEWLERLRRGEPLEESAALVLRPAVSSERPARWYVEDGSGRALAILSSAPAFEGVDPVAFAYVGCIPDSESTFMKKRFGELLRESGSGLTTG